MRPRLQPNQAILIICYKLAAELFMLILGASFLFFITEMALPGFVSARINFSTPYILITLLFLPLVFLRHGLPENQNRLQASNIGAGAWSLSPLTLTVLSFLIAVLLMNDMHGLPLATSALILATLFFVIFFVLSTFFNGGRRRRVPSTPVHME